MIQVFVSVVSSDFGMESNTFRQLLTHLLRRRSQLLQIFKTHWYSSLLSSDKLDSHHCKNSAQLFELLQLWTVLYLQRTSSKRKWRNWVRMWPQSSAPSCCAQSEDNLCLVYSKIHSSLMCVCVCVCFDVILTESISIQHILYSTPQLASQSLVLL